MRIIILGNGFDLASDLPTKYCNYFDSRFDEIEPIKRILNKYFSEVMEMKFNSDDHISAIKELDSYADMAIAEFSSIEFLNNIHFNYWDIYFHCKKEIIDKDIKEFEWNNVEDQILKLVKAYNFNVISNRYQYSDSKFMSLDNLFKLIKNGTSLRVNTLDNNSLYEIFHLFFTIKYFKGKSISINEKNIHNVLLDELIVFEENFRTYITAIMDAVMNNKEASYLYLDNFKRLTNRSLNNHYLLNFNYTSALKVSNQSNMNDNDKKMAAVLNITNSIKSNNVHGLYSDICIFGIDQSNLEADSYEYIFSKTYRKISSHSKIFGDDLPDYQQNMEVLFHGHSLSNADYSYFQSIFDHYDIYHNKVKLIFSYTPYGKKEEHNQQRHNYYSKVTSLLREYGNTMSNKDHGNNLVHKILLENRLVLKEVSMENIFKSKDTYISSIQSIDAKTIQLNSSIMKKRSKNYGEQTNYSITTWFGVNVNKLTDDKIEYLQFNIADENISLTLKSLDFINLIDNNLSPVEKEKYLNRNSFDTYIFKSKFNGKYYITRLGSHLKEYIEIK